MDDGPQWFIVVDREGAPAEIVGPYKDEDTAVDALNNSVFIDSLALENSLEILALQFDVRDGMIQYIIPPEETPENGYPDAEVIPIDSSERV